MDTSQILDLLLGCEVLKSPSIGGFQILFVLSKDLAKTSSHSSSVLHLLIVGKETDSAE